MERHTRRSAMLVVKLLNNLINEVSFDGMKEPYMLPLNPFISQDNIRKIQQFITNLVTLDDSKGEDFSFPVSRGLVAEEVADQAPNHLTHLRTSLEVIKKSALSHVSQLSGSHPAVQTLGTRQPHLSLFLTTATPHTHPITRVCAHVCCPSSITCAMQAPKPRRKARGEPRIAPALCLSAFFFFERARGSPASLYLPLLRQSPWDLYHCVRQQSCCHCV
jgi:hypothetical protein